MNQIDGSKPGSVINGKETTLDENKKERTETRTKEIAQQIASDVNSSNSNRETPAKKVVSIYPSLQSDPNSSSSTNPTIPSDNNNNSKEIPKNEPPKNFEKHPHITLTLVFDLKKWFP